MALWLISIQLGMASGRQLTNRPLGRPACSSAARRAASLAALGVHGVGLETT